MKSCGMNVSGGTRWVRLRGLSVALMLLSTCACTDCADRNVTAEAGETAALPCECPSNQPPYLVWLKADGKQQLVVNYYKEEDNKNDQTAAEYRNRTELRLTGDCSLELYSVQRSDEGLYKCYYQRSPLRHDNIYLQVTVAPSPPICKIEGVVEYYENINLTCRSEEGTPAPTYRWQSYNTINIPRPIPPNATDQNGVLSLYNINKETSGFFICTSTNEIRSARCNLTLAVMPLNVCLKR